MDPSKISEYDVLGLSVGIELVYSGPETQITAFLNES